MALARWILVGPEGTRTVLAADDAASLTEAALGEGRGSFTRRPAPARSALESAWLPRGLVLGLSALPGTGPKIRGTLGVRLALAPVEGAPGPTLLDPGVGDRQRSLALDELLGCWADLAAELALFPLAVGVEGGEVWARLNPGQATTDDAADRLLLLHAACEITADARGLALSRFIVERRCAATGATTRLDVEAGLHDALAAAAAGEDP